jgi:mRNA interferase MazF
VVANPEQGELWWAEAEDRRRPVLIVTPTQVVPVLTRIVVAPVTRTIRNIPSEVPRGPEDGLHDECVASFDSIQPIAKSYLVSRIGPATEVRRKAMCQAMAAVSDC